MDIARCLSKVGMSLGLPCHVVLHPREVGGVHHLGDSIGIATSSRFQSPVAERFSEDCSTARWKVRW